VGEAATPRSLRQQALDVGAGRGVVVGLLARRQRETDPRPVLTEPLDRIGVVGEPVGVAVATQRTDSLAAQVDIEVNRVPSELYIGPLLNGQRRP
jgi:hypothetical protein